MDASLHHKPPQMLSQIVESWLKSWVVDLCKRCHYACVETVNHFRLHPISITDICKVPRTSCVGFRFSSVTTAARNDDFIGTLNITSTLRLYTTGGATGMSNFSMTGTSNFGASTLGAQMWACWVCRILASRTMGCRP